ncbi:MAG TPA: 4Fe-4S dicluster domain-containing protein [Gaiellaceae bacterium]|nr:4Fe-4S dicluster domain-containing protein [Gaiellaceae bacterium]
MAETLAAADLDSLFDALRSRGYRIVAPVVRDGAIVHGEADAAADLPAGWTDEQAPGSYRLERRDDGALFGYASGPQSWKSELLPSRVRLWQARREDGGFAVEEEPAAATPTAFVGVRPCELAAIAVQDRVFLDGRFQDRDYAARRADVFLVAVECGTPSSLCFCTAQGTGPGATEGFDLALTELLEGGHRFLVRAGSTAGEAVLAKLPTRAATRDDVDAAGLVVASAAHEMRGRFDVDGVHDLLLRNLESPVWDEVAERCLSCGNCTLVCPTCFCTHVEDTSTLDGTGAARERVWDTCFSLRYAEMHGGNTRPSTRARYRQWLTHKLATWEDQFGVSGCVGCGRCIAWCPVGIDIREEVAAIRGREEEHAHA